MRPSSTARHLLPALALAVALAACGGGAPDDGAPAPGTPTDSEAPPAMDDQPDEDVPPATAPNPLPPQAVPATRLDGVGPARFGMTADQVRAVWGGPLEDNPAEGPACFHLNPAGQPDIAWFAMMFGDGKLVRYSVSNGEMVAPGGGRQGMAATEIAERYDAVDVRPHQYTDGHYLRVAGQGDAVIVFETDGTGVVTEWRVGIPPYVDYVEGCA